MTGKNYGEYPIVRVHGLNKEFDSVPVVKDKSLPNNLR